MKDRSVESEDESVASSENLSSVIDIRSTGESEEEVELDGYSSTYEHFDLSVIESEDDDEDSSSNTKSIAITAVIPEISGVTAGVLGRRTEQREPGVFNISGGRRTASNVLAGLGDDDIGQ